MLLVPLSRASVPCLCPCRQIRDLYKKATSDRYPTAFYKTVYYPQPMRCVLPMSSTPELQQQAAESVEVATHPPCRVEGGGAGARQWVGGSGGGEERCNVGVSEPRCPTELRTWWVGAKKSGASAELRTSELRPDSRT